MREILISLSNNNITTAEYHQNIKITVVFIWGCRGWGCGSCLFACVKISRCQDFINFNVGQMANLFIIRRRCYSVENVVS